MEENNLKISLGEELNKRVYASVLILVFFFCMSLYCSCTYCGINMFKPKFRWHCISVWSLVT